MAAKAPAVEGELMAPTEPLRRRGLVESMPVGHYARTDSAVPFLFRLLVLRALAGSECRALHPSPVFVRAFGRSISSFDGVTEQLDHVSAHAELPAGEHVLYINLRAPRPFSVAGRFHLVAAPTLSGSWTPFRVCLSDAKVSTTPNDSSDAALGNYALHDDVVVDETARLKLGDARINKFSAHNPTKSLHCHREETARVGIEVGGETIGVGIGVEGRSDKCVTFVVNCLTATLADA